jgi:hypothetical protein
MFIKIKIARIYRKNIIIYMGVEEEQLGGAMRKYRSMKAKLAKAKKAMPKKMVAKKAVPKHSKPPSRVAMSRPKPIYRGRLGMHLGGQGMGGMYDMLANSMQQQPAQVAAPPAAPPVATPAQQVAQFTQQMHQQMHQQNAVQGGRPHRRSRSPAKKAAKAKKAVVGKAMKPSRKKMLKRGGSEEEQDPEEKMEEIQSGGFQALESLVASLSGGGYGRKRVVRRRPVAPRRSPSPVARRRRPVARRT